MEFFFILYLGLFAQLNTQDDLNHHDQRYQFPYDLTEPGYELTMPKKLMEISGLGIDYTNENCLLAIQDEDGVIFYINKNTGKVDRELSFWKDGDYEGVEMVESEIFVVKSTGTIYQVSNPGKASQSVEKFKFFLSSENDIEGLGYDKYNHRLLLACKAKAGEGPEYKYKKGIYAFNLATKTMSEKPVFLLSSDAIHDYLGTAPQIRKLEKVIEFFNSNFAFSPSGLAVHPKTGNIYISSSVGKMIIVLNPEGVVIHIEKLSKKVHAQPEGICFDSDGTLYIANEGKSKDGMIYQFEYAPPKQ